MSAEHLDQVLRIAGHAAAGLFIDTPGPNVGRMTAAIQAAFECALGNGLIQITDPGSWPTWIALDPPFSPIEGEL